MEVHHTSTVNPTKSPRFFLTNVKTQTRLYRPSDSCRPRQLSSWKYTREVVLKSPINLKNVLPGVEIR